MTSAAGDATVTVFTSNDHPGTRSYPLVFSQSVVRPMSTLFLPLMIATLIAALTYQPVLNVLLLGFPAAMVAAFLWTAFKLRREIAEIQVRHQTISLRSTHEVAWHGARIPRILPLFDVRDYGGWLVIAAGDADYLIARDNWPRYDELRARLREAVYE